jgi:CRISPR/Cas system CSM-associated protein Csm5 (group 7 of RAMP superfamily)
MNEENNISMDFEAERQLMSPIINVFNEEISTTNNVLFDPKLPESDLIQSLESTELPQTQFIVSSKTNETNFVDNLLPESQPISQNFVDNLLPESQPISQNFGVELPEASFMIPTETTDSFSSRMLEAQFSKTITPTNIESDVDSLYQKTKSLEESIMNLQNRGDGWLKTKERDSFEERPTVEPTNLVFEQRKMRSSTIPEWA